MTEEEARIWLLTRCGLEVFAKLDQYRAILMRENDRQNLIAPSTVPTIWTRHLLDSAQLIDHAPDQWHNWVDVGSGAGLPGLVVAVMTGRKLVLIEPRRLRVEFLRHCRDALNLTCVEIIQGKAENVMLDGPAEVISARAVAKLDTVLAATRRFANTSTCYILPKGKSAQLEVAIAQRTWQGVFHVEQSIVDPKSGIVVANGIGRR